MNTKQYATKAAITLAYAIVLLGVLTLGFGFLAGVSSAITELNGVVGAVLVAPIVYIVLVDYREWVRGD